jgi:hypothetical protein
MEMDYFVHLEPSHLILGVPEVGWGEVGVSRVDAMASVVTPRLGRIAPAASHCAYMTARKSKSAVAQWCGYRGSIVAVAVQQIQYNKCACSYNQQL